jgi:hypothetical protein
MKVLLATALTALVMMPSPSTAHDGHRDWNTCKYEDGSGQARCIWDARHQGNGKGQSLKIINGGDDDAKYIRISHRRAKHLLGSNH